VDGSGSKYISEGTTLYKGSTSIEACVPKRTQMSPEAGQTFFTPTTAANLTTTVGATTFSACVEACPTDKCCLSQFVGNVCTHVVLDPMAATVAGDHHQLVYKLPPSTLVGASSVADDDSVKAKMISSGHYAHCNLGDANTVANWLTVGTALGSNARTFRNPNAPVAWDQANSKAECKKKCDDSNVCIGFIASSTSSTSNVLSCTYRGGVDFVGGRSFFALPEASAATDIHSFGW
jgi:hypothetical protein